MTNQPEWQKDMLIRHAPHVDVSKALMGTDEWAGPARNNPRILAMWNEIGLTDPYFDTDEVPWCAASMGYVLKKSGMKYLKTGLARDYERSYPSRPENIIWTKVDGKRGQVDGEPPIVLGAIAVLKRGTLDSGKGHIGLVNGRGAKPGTISILGGNQSDTQRLSDYKLSDLRHMIWPEPADESDDFGSTGNAHADVFGKHVPLRQPEDLRDFPIIVDGRENAGTDVSVRVPELSMPKDDPLIDGPFGKKQTAMAATVTAVATPLSGIAMTIDSPLVWIVISIAVTAALATVLFFFIKRMRISRDFETARINAQHAFELERLRLEAKPRV